MIFNSLTIKEIRIYAEVFEQGLFFMEHVKNSIKNQIPIKIVKAQGNIMNFSNFSIISLLRIQKKFDLLVSVIISSNNNDYELPILVVEFSTAVKTDDHEWQRFDGIFWANFYQIPFLKISSRDKESPTAKGDFGGGTKLSLLDEIYILYKNGGFMFHINWEKLENCDYLATHHHYFSCPPYSEELERFLKIIINLITKLTNPLNFIKNIRNHFGPPIEPQDIRTKFPPPKSNRLIWLKKKNEFVIKINRFGHAMDPERGGLAFFKMLTNSLNIDCKIVAEFNIERKRILGRESYKSLFDGVSQEKNLMTLVCKIFRKKNNVIDLKTALIIFSLATNTQDLFIDHKFEKNIIYISDQSLMTFLHSSKNNTIKNILFYSDKIILTNKERNIILSIKWNKEIIENYFEEIKINTYNYLMPLPLRKCQNKDINEDIITYLCVQIIRKSKFRIIAVSYPSAQGERCILIGEGRHTKRKYIDIIAIKKFDSNFNILLQENKDNLNNISVKKDIKKMIDIKEKHTANLLLLVGKFYPLEDNFDIYLGIGGKYKRSINQSSIDYIMLLDLSNINNNQVSWSIGLINLKLQDVFKPIIINDKLEGTLNLPTTLYIVEKNHQAINQKTLINYID
ncbi:MAG: hypothetical protein ACTSQP_20090 [Promethearchaeota archaeon]